MVQFTRTVTDASEYKELVEYAEGLGLKIAETSAKGYWNTDEGPIWPKSCVVEKVGRKYFYLKLRENDEAVYQCEPEKHTDKVKDGKMEITFTS